MVEPLSRNRLGTHPRSDDDPEWEVFVRNDGEDEPLRHVGSVTAPTADEAHRVASRLFGWYATDVWLTRADAVHRYGVHDLDREADPVPRDPDGEQWAVEREGLE